MCKQGKRCMISRKIDLYNIFIDCLFKYRCFIGHGIGIQTYIQNFQSGLLNAACIGIYYLFIRIQQIHIHDQNLCCFINRHFSGRDTVCYVFDAADIYQLQLWIRFKADRFIQPLLNITETNAFTACFRNNAYFFVMTLYVDGRDRRKNTLDMISKCILSLLLGLDNAVHNILFIHDFLFFNSLYGSFFHS